jgi:hypothetical protein
MIMRIVEQVTFDKEAEMDKAEKFKDTHTDFREELTTGGVISFVRERFFTDRVKGDKWQRPN